MIGSTGLHQDRYLFGIWCHSAARGVSRRNRNHLTTDESLLTVHDRQHRERERDRQTEREREREREGGERERETDRERERERQRDRERERERERIKLTKVERQKKGGKKGKNLGSRHSTQSDMF